MEKNTAGLTGAFAHAYLNRVTFFTKIFPKKTLNSFFLGIGAKRRPPPRLFFGYFFGKIRPRSGRELFFGLFFGKIWILYDHLREISENLSRCSGNEVKTSRGALKTKIFAPAARTRSEKN